MVAMCTGEVEASGGWGKAPVPFFILSLLEYLMKPHSQAPEASGKRLRICVWTGCSGWYFRRGESDKQHDLICASNSSWQIRTSYIGRRGKLSFREVKLPEVTVLVNGKAGILLNSLVKPFLELWSNLTLFVYSPFPETPDRHFHPTLPIFPVPSSILTHHGADLYKFTGLKLTSSDFFFPHCLSCICVPPRRYKINNLFLIGKTLGFEAFHFE